MRRLRDIRHSRLRLHPGVYVVPLDQFISCRDVSELQFNALALDLNNEGSLGFQSLDDPASHLYFFKTAPEAPPAPNSPKPTKRYTSRSKLSTSLQDKMPRKKTLKKAEGEGSALKSKLGLETRTASRDLKQWSNTDHLTKKLALITKKHPKELVVLKNETKVVSTRDPRSSYKTNRLVEKTFRTTNYKTQHATQTYSAKKATPSIDLKVVRTDKKAVALLNSSIREKSQDPYVVRFDVTLGAPSHLQFARKVGNIYESSLKVRSVSLRASSQLRSRLM